MRKILYPLLLLALVAFSSHDMYLKLDSYFLAPNSSASIKLFNGTFDRSDNAIARNRMLDVSLVGNGSRTAVDTAQWSEKDSMTILSFTTGEAGTWVAGVSTAPRNIEMTAEDFNQYLEHDGVLDMLEWRKQNAALDQPAVEQYAKHVKTIFQVGETHTPDWQTPLGYPIEFVPLDNPYDLHAGDDFRVKLLWEGQPLPNQIVYVDSDQSGHSHSHAGADDHDHQHATAEAHTHADEDTHDHSHATAKEHTHAGGKPHDHKPTTTETHSHSANLLRSDAAGIVNFKVGHDGIWHLRTIHLVQSQEPGLTHESNWATLTFGVDHGHSHTAGANDHSHEHSSGIPAYVYWLGSIAVIGGLFFWFNRKN